MQDAVDDELGELDDPADAAPSSQVRAIGTDTRARRLVVDCGLRGAEAEAAWITVTDSGGALFFEGPPSADGCVNVTFDDAPELRVARVRLETARLHRSAEVELGSEPTTHRFSG